MRERRRWQRRPVRGDAALLESGYANTVYRVEDLSHGGARLAGGPTPPRSESVGLLLHLPTGFVDVRCRIVRRATQRDGDCSFAVAFDCYAPGGAERVDRALRFAPRRGGNAAPDRRDRRRQR